jgi:hypothetical protein
MDYWCDYSKFEMIRPTPGVMIVTSPLNSVASGDTISKIIILKDLEVGNWRDGR